MKAYLVSGGLEGLQHVLLARNFQGALDGWRAWSRRQGWEAGGWDPDSVELVESESVLVTKDALEVLQADDAAWFSTGRGVLWDVVGERTLDLGTIKGGRA